MIRAVFVAGSGTDVGKTYVTASLTRSLRAAGRRVRVCKPLASGIPPEADPAFRRSDPVLLLAAAGRPVTAANLDACSPWRFAAPLSPDVAAAAEGRRVQLSSVVDWTRSVLAEPGSDHVLVEGVGGVMSPIAIDATGLDLAAALGLPVLLVCGSYLGSISHGLTALVAMRARGLDVMTLLVNAGDTPAAPLEATVDAFRRFADAPVRMLGTGAEAPVDLLDDPTPV